MTDFCEPAILVTGMSGIGKSTALIGLARAGFATVDTDYGPWIRVVDGEPLWVEHLIDELLSHARDRHVMHCRGRRHAAQRYCR